MLIAIGAHIKWRTETFEISYSHLIDVTLYAKSQVEI